MFHNGPGCQMVGGVAGLDDKDDSFCPLEAAPRQPHLLRLGDQPVQNLMRHLRDPFLIVPSSPDYWRESIRKFTRRPRGALRGESRMGVVSSNRNG
jgi:hypothetical protein